MLSSSYCLPQICLKRVTSADNLAETSTHSDSTDEVIDLKGDQFEDKKAEAESLQLSSVDMWALGLTTAIAGHYFSWNAGLGAGFGSYLIAMVLISTAYLCLILCISELSSALPFAGGAYGIARVTLGIYPGYLVACCDSYKSILYVSGAAFAMGEEITRITHGSRDLEAVWWFLFYFTSVVIQAWGGKMMWKLNFALAMLCSGILLIYILGSIKYANFVEYSQLDGRDGDVNKYFYGGMYEFMHILPLPCWFFLGVQSINLACGQLRNPKRDVPKGCIAAVVTVMATSITVLFITCSLPPSITFLKERLRPLTTGFSLMFEISRDYSTAFSIPAMIASGFGFMYFYSQQLSSMGRSGLLNHWMGKEWPRRKTPVVALVVGALIGYGMCRVRFYIPASRPQFYNVSMLGAFATYLSIFASFIMFRLYFPAIKREFESPLGIAGAVYGFVVFTLAFISICAFQDSQLAILIFAIIIAAATIYYYLVVKDRQVFSEEEKIVLFKAYLVKNNKAKNQRLKKGANTRQSAMYKVTANASTDNLALQNPTSMEAQGNSSPGGPGVRSKPGKQTPVSRQDVMSDRTQAYNDAPSLYPAGAGASARGGVELPMMTMSGATAGLTYSATDNEAALSADLLQSFSSEHPDCVDTQIAPIDGRMAEV